MSCWDRPHPIAPACQKSPPPSNDNNYRYRFRSRCFVSRTHCVVYVHANYGYDDVNGRIGSFFRVYLSDDVMFDNADLLPAHSGRVVRAARFPTLCSAGRLRPDGGRPITRFSRHVRAKRSRTTLACSRGRSWP